MTKRIPSQRFWPKVDTSSGPDLCWPWMGKSDPNGYGYFEAEGYRGAHRVSYFLAYGAIPDGMFVCHRCDNPPCVNPGHLFLGTQADNMSDMWRKGRGASPFHARPLAKLTEEDVREIRRVVRSGVPQSEMAAKYGVSRPTISNLIARKTWAHVV